MQLLSKANELCRLLYVSESQLPQIERLLTLVSEQQLSLNVSPELVTGKLNQKYRTQLCAESPQPILLLDDKNKLSWLSSGLSSGLSGGLSVAPEWDKLQRRVVSAGRKTELLLQAAKITADSQVIDATAGFGHDSLILASTGARVIMLEQQPIMALLLLAEQQRMSTQPNWQKLMSRLKIINTDALSYFADNADTLAASATIEVVYLDPMFPEDSYQDSKTGKGAKVGKHMQALHQLARPPTLDEEQQLLQCAQAFISTHINTDKSQGRVIVKRPQDAPSFAMQPPDDSWGNDAVRFDGYLL